MTDKEREDYRRRLRSLADRLRGDLSSLADETARAAGGEAGGGLSNAPFHLADLGTDNFEHELSTSLLENADQTLGEVAAALGRIEQGTYGRCERCGRGIPAGRLKAVPFARYCVECARAAEREGEDGKAAARV
jgi:RNA polymerase-binding transcription factor DksA